MGKHALLRVYAESITLSPNTYVSLEETTHHYISKVMRARPGRNVYLYNNTDGEYRSEIIAIDKRITRVLVHERFAPPETPPPFTVCLSPIKPEAVRFAVQKITELGAARFIPVICKRTTAKALPTEKLQAIAAEASEQCERVYVPEICAPVSLHELITTLPDHTALIYGDETGGEHSARTPLVIPSEGAYILTGPEGGFSEEERTTLKALSSSLSVSLGPRVLKSETAAIAALITAQLHQGDWHEHPRYGATPRIN